MTALPSPASLDTVEFRLVAAACAAVARGEAAPPPDPAADPRAVLALTERHRLAAPVLAMLAELLAASAPDVATTLTSRARHGRILALEQARHTALLSAALDAGGIPHLVVKGVALAQALYGDVAARSSKDIDLLVAPADIAAAGDAIAATGFARIDADHGDRRKHRSYGAGAIQVELHHRLIDLSSFVPLAFDGLWTRRGAVSLLGRRVPVMSDVDTLLYLCAHGSEHVWFRLKWVQDIARIVARDPCLVVAAHETAVRAGFDRVLAAALRLADDVLGAALPGDLGDDRPIRRATRLAKVALAAPAELAHIPTAGWIARRSLVQLGARRDWRYRRDLLRELATAPRSFDPARAGGWSLLHLPARAARFWRTRR